MTEHIFITAKGDVHAHWKKIFPSAKGVSCFSNYENFTKLGIVWFEWPREAGELYHSELKRLLDLESIVVVLSLFPYKDQALTAISLGARGYCHSLSAEKQFKEISVVVLNHGIWVGPDVMSDLIALTNTRKLRLQNGEVRKKLETLTKREREIAEQVSNGLNNRQISDKYKISTRTVKSHLSPIFKKLGIKDRLQLAILLNNLKPHDT